jgi:hypothetical protein
MSVGFAGCSADMQTRFSDSSFSNPFASPESVRCGHAAERRELPQYGGRRRLRTPVPGRCRGCCTALIRPDPAACREWARVVLRAVPAAIETTATVRRAGRGRRLRHRPAPRSLSAPAIRSASWPSANVSTAILQANGYRPARASPGQQPSFRARGFMATYAPAASKPATGAAVQRHTSIAAIP